MGGGRQDFYPEGEGLGMELLLQRLEVTIELFRSGRYLNPITIR